jgi:CheY-like chemotaxis protein
MFHHRSFCNDRAAEGLRYAMKCCGGGVSFGSSGSKRHAPAAGIRRHGWRERCSRLPVMWNPDDDEFDDESLRLLIIARLRREGFEVIEADSGSQALEVLAMLSRSQRPCEQLDLLVMDVRMPGATGIEIGRMLRAAGWTVPVVLITAFPDRELLVEAAQLGFTVLAKPFALERLSNAAISAMMS